MNNSPNKITVLFVPQNTGRTFSFLLSSWQLKLTKFFFILLSLLTIYVLFQYFIYLNNNRNYNDLVEINEFQYFRLQQILNSYNINSNDLNQLSQFDNKLRLILNFKEPNYQHYPIEVQNASLDIPFKDNKYLDRNQQLLTSIDKVQQENAINILTRKQSFLEMQELIADTRQTLLSIPSMKPVRVGYLTSKFGKRKDPFSGALTNHYGIDWAYLPYTAIYATANGRVKRAYKSVSYGNTIIIDHGNRYETLYAHLAEVLVKNGQRVKRGEIIGRMGNTGKRSTATHLHYEVLYKSKPVNPEEYILEQLPEVVSGLFVEF